MVIEVFRCSDDGDGTMTVAAVVVEMVAVTVMVRW